MGHGRPGRPVRSRCGGPCPGALARARIGAATDALAPRGSGGSAAIRSQKTARQDWGWADMATAKFRRARLSAPSSSPALPEWPGPNRPLRQSIGLAAVRLGPDRRSHKADAARQSQPDAEAPVKTGARAQRDSPLPRLRLDTRSLRLDTRIRIRACPGTGLETPDSKTEFSILKSGIRKPKFKV